VSVADLGHGRHDTNPNMKKRPPKGPLLSRKTRHRPTLPPPLDGSTIGAGGLNFRVRYGTGCDPSAMGTGKLFNCVQFSDLIHLRWTWSSDSDNLIVSAGNFKPSPRPISTGRLNASLRFHLRPINPVV
jgi:hypothetical protein